MGVFNELVSAETVIVGNQRKNVCALRSTQVPSPYRWQSTELMGVFNELVSEKTVIVGNQRKNVR